MQEETERVEVKDFAFRSVRRFRLFQSPESGEGGVFNGLTSYRLLTISNTYGLIFVAWPGQTLKVVPTSEIHRFLDDASRDRDSEVTDFKSAWVHLGGGASSPIVRLHCNCDGTALAVCYNQPTPIAHIYDVRALSPDYPGPKPVAPFCRIRLDDVDGSSICDFQWNPTTPDVFSSCCLSGTVVVVSVNLNQISTFTVQGAIKRTAEGSATCVSWSPKGKQLAIGFDNGSVCQYKPQGLQLAKKWSPPSQAVAIMLHRLVDICWLSTNQFALVSTGGRPEGDQLFLIHLALPKESAHGGSSGHLVYVNYDDVCFGSAGERRWAPTRYLMQHIHEWAMLLCSSTASMETAVLAWKAEAKRWQVWDLDDSARCQLPLTTARSDETYPLGVDIDRTPEAPVQLKNPEGEVVLTIPPAPVVLLLSTDGALCPFRMVYKTSGVALCQPARKIDNWSDVKVGAVTTSQFISPKPEVAPSSFAYQQPVATMMQPKPVLNTAQPAPSFGPTATSGDVSATFTLPLPQQRKQPIAGGGQVPGFGQQQQPLNAPSQQPQLPPAAAAPAVPPAPGLGSRPQLQRPTGPEQGQQETEEERAEREKNRLLRMDMVKWMVDFEKQLRGLKTRLAEPPGLPGNRDRLAEEIRKLQEIEGQVEELRGVIAGEKSQADTLRTSICGQLVRADQVKLMAERRRSKEFHTLLRYRPLSARQEEDMKALRHRHREVRQSVENLVTRVERMQLGKQPWQRGWTDSPAMTKGQKKNSMDMVYRTIGNMQAIVMQQKQRLEAIKRQEATTTKKKESGRRGKTYGLDETDQLADSLMDTQLTDDSNDSMLHDLLKKPSDLVLNKTPYRMNDSLRRMLEKRDSTPRRTTVPVLKPPTFTYTKKDSTTIQSAPAQTKKPEQQEMARRTTSASVLPGTTPTFVTSTPVGTQVRSVQNIGQGQRLPFAPSPLAAEKKTTAPVPVPSSTQGPSQQLAFTPPPVPRFSTKPAAVSTVPTFVAPTPSFATAVPSLMPTSVSVANGKQAATSQKPAAPPSIASFGMTPLPASPDGKKTTMPASTSVFTAPIAMPKATTTKPALAANVPIFGNLAANLDVKPKEAPTSGKENAQPSFSFQTVTVPATTTSSKLPFPTMVSNEPAVPSLAALIAQSAAPSFGPKLGLSTAAPPNVTATATAAPPNVTVGMKTEEAPKPREDLFTAINLKKAEPAAAAQAVTTASVQKEVTAAPSLAAASAATQASSVPTQSETTAPAAAPQLPKAPTIPFPVATTTADAKPATTATAAIEAKTEEAKPAAPVEAKTEVPPVPVPAPVPSVPTTQAQPAAATESVQEEEMNANGDMEADVVPATTAPAAPSSPAAGFSFLTGTATSPAAAPATTAPPAASGGGIFGGGGGFFSGLGGPPNPEAAKKNVFATAPGFGLGSPLAAKPTNEQQIKSLFGGGTPKAEGAPSPGFGSFGGGSPAGQQGFGGFGSSPGGSTGGFGGFGGKAAFGGGSVFGGSPAFGGIAAPSGSVFGGTPAFGQSPPAAPAAASTGFGSFGGSPGSGFAAFAQKPMPTFGALAGNTGPTPPAPAASPFGGGGFGGASPFSGFGALPQQQQQPTGSFFGGQQQQQQAPQQQQSSFSQWR